jgi:4-hydroxy-tetrahydrodipicolinate reductase
MNIALIGYGKMGHTIERIALERGHQIVLRVTSESRPGLSAEDLRAADVAIEFTSPESAKGNVLLCHEAGVPVVCGTTGWGDELARTQQTFKSDGRGALLYASNFSVGVNIFFLLAQRLAELMNGQPDYDVRIEEIHHIQKKDAPSGTAITLAERTMAELTRKKSWVLGPASDAAELSITAHREEGVPGTHRILYTSSVDDIEMTHTAHNRDGFALGAVLAAEFLKGKTGVFGMRDVLGLPA